MLKNYQSHPTRVPLPKANGTLANNQGRDGKKKKYRPTHLKWNNNNEKQEKNPQKKSLKDYENVCFRCGMKEHWSCVCRTPKYLADLYQASKHAKGKEIETNFIGHESPINITHLDVSDFFEDPNGKIDHLIGDGHVKTE